MAAELTAPRAGRPARPDVPSAGAAAAFFDLDKTLIQGSSAFQFGRAAYRRGLLAAASCSPTRWPTCASGCAGPPTRNAGPARPHLGLAGGDAGPSTWSGSGRMCWPGSCRASTRRCWPSPTSTRTPAGGPTSSPPPRRSWPRCWPTVLAFDGAIGSHISEVVDGVYTGPAGRRFIYRGGKARRSGAGRAGGHRPRGVLRVLGFGVGSADAPRGRPAGGRQSRRRWRGSPASGLGGAPLRPAGRRLKTGRRAGRGGGRRPGGAAVASRVRERGSRVSLVAGGGSARAADGVRDSAP